MYTAYFDSPLGKIKVISDGVNLTGLYIPGQYQPQEEPKPGEEQDSILEIFQKTKHWLKRYFNKENPDMTELLLAPEGNEFRQTVWKLLCEIPYGTTTTYGDIARKTAQLLHKEKMSAQAVGNAIGHNPIAIVIPCHRVIGADGSLVGYGGGLDIKIKLLEIEKTETRREQAQ